MGYSYLASPYTHPDIAVRESRFSAAELKTAALLNQRVWVYSPIVHCHALALMYKLPPDAAFWRDYNFAMLSRAERLLVLQLDGWKDSLGVRGEMKEAHRIAIPVEFIE